MAPHYAKIYADIGRPFQTFATMAEAQLWAQAMIRKSVGQEPD
nr:hypothetical protein [Rhodoferax sp.]